MIIKCQREIKLCHAISVVRTDDLIESAVTIKTFLRALSHANIECSNLCEIISTYYLHFFCGKDFPGPQL